MFLGEYEHTLDAKARLAIPARFRSQLGDGAILSKGMGSCLSLYPSEHWEQKSNELIARMAGDELRDFERRIYPSACEVELDGQGRVIVPAKLRAYAKLEINVTIAGVRDHMEIWDRATWDAYQTRLEDEEKHIPF